MASILKELQTRRIQKREDKVWSVYDQYGHKDVERLNWLDAATYSSWQQKTDREQGILLLSTKHLAFTAGHAYMEIELESVTSIEWAGGLGSVVVLFTNPRYGNDSGGAFDFDVFGQTGGSAFVLKDLFASQLRSQCQLLALAEKTAPKTVKPPLLPPSFHPFLTDEEATPYAKRRAETEAAVEATSSARYRARYLKTREYDWPACDSAALGSGLRLTETPATARSWSAHQRGALTNLRLLAKSHPILTKWLLLAGLVILGLGYQAVAQYRSDISGRVYVSSVHKMAPTTEAVADDDLLLLGRTACIDVSQNGTKAYQAGVERMAGTGIGESIASAVYESAFTYLCPPHSY